MLREKVLGRRWGFGDVKKGSWMGDCLKLTLNLMTASLTDTKLPEDQKQKARQRANKEKISMNNIYE